MQKKHWGLTRVAEHLPSNIVSQKERKEGWRGGRKGRRKEGKKGH
jgi:hypothetical protein